MSLMTRGVDMLRRRLAASAGETVTYAGADDRGTGAGASASVVAWFGRPEGLAAELADRVTVDSDDADALIPVANLVLSATAITPAKGDRITRTVNALPVVYEARPRTPVEPVWRYSDAGRTVYRVQLKKVSG
jgi:hypothetical protein